MKKTLFTTAFMLILMGSQVFSQGFSLVSKLHGELGDGAEINVLAGPNTINELALEIEVKNNTDEVKNVRVLFEAISQMPNSELTFCWGGGCLPPEVTETAGADIAPNEHMDFSGHYKMIYEFEPIYGSSQVKYTFENTNDVSKPITITVNYIVNEGFEERAITLFSQDGIELLENDQEFVIESKVSEADEFLVSKFNVKNNTDANIDVMVRRERIDLLPTAEDSFCWGTCFPPNIDVSNRPLTIEANSILENQFTGDYAHKGTVGESIIRYTFYLENNLYNSTSVKVIYKITPDGIDEYSQVFESLKTYPIPAKDMLNIDYKFKKENINANVVILNILGETIYNQEITNNEGQIKINTSNLENGMYFYSIFVDNKSSVTKKFIVSH